MISPSFASISTPFIAAIVETWVKPHLNELSKQRSLNKYYFQLSSENFSDYLKRAYDNQCIMNTLAFRNSQKTIDELYIPLNLRFERHDEECYSIDKYCDTIFYEKSRTLIVDNAGMGKSTLLKWLFVCAIRENKGIPIFIELRKLSEHTDLICYLSKELNGLCGTIPQEYIIHLLNRGHFIIFLDGVDEIPTPYRKVVINMLHEFVSLCPLNTFIMSSRYDNSLASFGSFKLATIDPLTLNQSFSLIHKYCPSNELAIDLISNINSDNNLSLLSEFLPNPLLTSLLCKTYEYKRTIPYKKHIFYKQVYDALYESHDLTKDGTFNHNKASGLDIHDFHKILKGMGYLSFLSEINSYSEDSFIRLIDKSKSILYRNLDFSSINFLNDSISSVPFFIQEGCEYRWVHKSFRDYFAAQFICYDLKNLDYACQEKILEKIDIMDFCYDLEIDNFQEIFMLFLANDYIEYYEKTLDKFKIAEIESKHIETRISMLYVAYPFFHNIKNIPFEDFVGGCNDICKAKMFRSLTFITDKCLVGMMRPAALIELLNRKNDHSLLSPVSTPPIKVSKNSTKNFFLESKYTYAVIDDDMENIINTKKFFDYGTKRLYECSYFKDRGISLFPDYKKCKDFVEYIKNATNSRNQNIPIWDSQFVVETIGTVSGQ